MPTLRLEDKVERRAEMHRHCNANANGPEHRPGPLENEIVDPTYLRRTGFTEDQTCFLAK